MIDEPQQGKLPPDDFEPDLTPGTAVVYQIRIKSHLASDWADWFAGMVITLEEDGHMLLTGPLVDQAALHGLLRKVRDLGMPLVSVNPVPWNELQAEE